MLALEKMKNLINSNEISDNRALNLHIAVESYLKRLIFIGLRKKGVQYNVANKCASNYFATHSKELTIIGELLEIDINDIKRFRGFGSLDNFYLNYTSKFRNKRVHGGRGEYHNEAYLESIIKIDKAFIQTIESYFEKNGLPSAFDLPGSWCLKNKGTIKDEKEVYELLGISSPKEYEYDEAIKLIKKLKI